MIIVEKKIGINFSKRQKYFIEHHNFFHAKKQTTKQTNKQKTNFNVRHLQRQFQAPTH